MEQKTYLENVYGKFNQDGFDLTNDKVNELDVVVAARKKFSLVKFATQMNTFAIMGASNNVSKDVIENFSKAALDYAIKNNKGLPRGLQSGVVCFAVLVSSNVDESAKQWVEKKPKRHFAAFEMPVIFDLRNDELYYCKKTPIWGMVYYKSFRNFIEKYLKP